MVVYNSHQQGNCYAAISPQQGNCYAAISPIHLFFGVQLAAMTIHKILASYCISVSCSGYVAAHSGSQLIQT